MGYRELIAVLDRDYIDFLKETITADIPDEEREKRLDKRREQYKEDVYQLVLAALSGVPTPL